MRELLRSHRNDPGPRRALQALGAPQPYLRELSIVEDEFELDARTHSV